MILLFLFIYLSNILKGKGGRYKIIPDGINRILVEKRNRLNETNPQRKKSRDNKKERTG